MNYNEPPRDISSRWWAVARRMQAMGKTEGLSLISIVVLVDENGIPKLWLEPTCRKIEPKKSGKEILDILSAGTPLDEAIDRF